MKIIALGGEPGTGKTTLMKRIFNEFPFEEHYTDVKLVPYLKSGSLILLGKYDDTPDVFQGTDKMSMAVQQHAIDFVKSLPDDSVVLFEGDRLFNNSFLEFCSNYDLKIFAISAPKEVLQERYKQRGSEQNETWLKGRQSKVANILSNLTLQEYVTCYPNANKDDQEVLFTAIMKEIQ